MRQIATCPNGHKPKTETPFYYPVCCIDVDVELPVLAYADTTPANAFIDGITGVPDFVREAIHDEFCMPHCIECGEEAEWSDLTD